MYPDEENLEADPDSPPHVPLKFQNGFRGWHIVMDPDGQEVIELVSSDEDEGNGGGGEVVAVDPDPIAVLGDIEMA